MPDNRYNINTNFPSGVLISLLAQEMPDVWPSDLFPAGYTVAGGSGPDDVVTTGVLTITTPRALVPDEEIAAIDHFSSHDPSSALPPGTTTRATLPPPSVPGYTLYVRDIDRAGGRPGQGALVYADGLTWRRAADDADITTI